ncbi:hypothetical protein BJ508DRAFT_327532 [Ascobolus immersus RN42]|uniref:Uncharacterized protein n=1 Tax=Ascobolus immersus RN42 TaxID=1160509 RepID=A0A3N4I2J7_ASCIM|nr:hypothetical protein BJ508DRAFT_327532 [Ascobolus immersus RN42]
MPESELDREVHERLREAWEDEYQGNLRSAFFPTVAAHEKCFNSKNEFGLFAKILAIYNSSGVGKSRLVDKLGEETLVISFTFRLAGEIGFPPGDDEITDRLLHHGKNKLPYVTAILFLSAIFQIVKERWEAHEANSPAAEAEANAYDRIADIPFIKNNLILPCKALSDALSIITTKEEPVPIFLSFDGITNLITETKTRYGGGETDQCQLELFLWLRRILRLLREFPVWSLFISTDSSLNRIDREYGESRVPAPFISFPFDMELDRRCTEDAHIDLQESLRGFTSMQHMTATGRPLWHAFRRSSYTHFVSLAEQKLISSDSYTPSNDNQVLAVLSNRICLEFRLTNGNRVASLPFAMPGGMSSFLRTSVQSHLRVILETDSKHSLIRTHVPSEPIVAEAAASLLNKRATARLDHRGPEDGSTADSNWIDAVEVLGWWLMSKALIEKGKSGVTASMLLLVYTRDLLLSERNADEFKYSQPFLVADFLRKLLQPQDAEDVLISLSNSTKGDSVNFESTYHTTYMNFTHFTSTTSVLEPSSILDLVHGLLQHHAALQLHDDYWDLLIPMYCGNPDEEFNRKHLGVMLVQVNDQKQKLGHKVPASVYQRIFKSVGLQVCTVILELGSEKSGTKQLSSFDSSHYSFAFFGYRDTYGCMEGSFGTNFGNVLRASTSPQYKEYERDVANRLVNFQYHTFERRFKQHGKRFLEEGDASGSVPALNSNEGLAGTYVENQMVEYRISQPRDSQPEESNIPSVKRKNSQIAVDEHELSDVGLHSCRAIVMKKAKVNGVWSGN